MATQNPISTISYNSEAFLRERLDCWLRAHIIQAYQYICHKGEEGDKDHIHLRIEPNKRIDPMALSEELKEWIAGKDKPLGVRPWRPSKEEDWMLYAVHDADYLSGKYAVDSKEKLPYCWQDIKASADYDVETAFIRARSSAARSPASVVRRLQSGDRAINLISEGANPFTVTAVLRSLSLSEFEQLAAKNRELQFCISQILTALSARGLVWDSKKGAILDANS